MNPCLSLKRPSSAADELAAIARGCANPVILSARDVRSWIEIPHSTRTDRVQSGRRRATVSRQLFGHPSTPDLAVWLMRYAPPARIEVGLVEAHKTLAKINAGSITPQIGVLRLRRLAKRSWLKDRSNAIAPPRQVESDAAPFRTSVDSLAGTAIDLLRSVGLNPSRRAESSIAEAVDQGVDYLVDLATRMATDGPLVFEPNRARSVSVMWRASMRVAPGHPAGRALRRLVLGPSGLIHYAIRAEHGLLEPNCEQGQSAERIQAWDRTLARVESLLVGGDGSHESDSSAGVHADGFRSPPTF